MATLKSAGPHRTAIFACLVAAGFTQALNYRMHAPTRLRRAHCRMSADAGAPSSDGESLASRWRVMRNENGGLLLAAAGPQWQEELVDVVVERSAERPGLGLLLTEYLATDDAGLVLVDGLQPEGNAAVAASAPIQPGDAIIAVGEADGGDGTGASAEMVSVEGVTYDTLVGAIGEVPAASPIRVLLKRLTKRPTVQLTLKFPQAEQRDDELITLYPGAPLRRSILAQGVSLNDPLARRFDAGIGTGDCGGEGCCCTCAVEVVSGIELLSKQKTQERQMLNRFPRWRLACKAAIDPTLSEDAQLVVKVAPRGWDGFYADAECDIDGAPLKREGQK
mmetsp:Transcript_1435/g.2782  ORF Transcript_1435/g.2782 Transcript_1435/m.2782 type:complete len:335 (-) Transcript_1435:407-1411(-)